MQIMGFGWMFVLFLLCAWQYERLTQPAHLWIFRALYYLSRSAGQHTHFAKRPAIGLSYPAEQISKL